MKIDDDTSKSEKEWLPPRSIIMTPLNQFYQPDNNAIKSHTFGTVETKEIPELSVYRTKHILYLEPDRNSSLYQSVLNYQNLSREQFGPTEAHLYHPHCSMTGFFELPHHLESVEPGSFGHHLKEKQPELIKEIQQWVGQYLKGRQLEKPKVCAIKRTTEHSISIGLETSQPYKDLVLDLKEKIESFYTQILGQCSSTYPTPNASPDPAFLLSDTQPTMNTSLLQSFYKQYPSFKIRPKPIDHISLAYNRPTEPIDYSHSPTGAELSPLLMEKMENLAHQVVQFETCHQWFIVFYELTYQSHHLEQPHLFKEIFRYPL